MPLAVKMLALLVSWIGVTLLIVMVIEQDEYVPRPPVVWSIAMTAASVSMAVLFFLGLV